MIGLADDFKLVTRWSRMVCAPLGMHDWIANSPRSYRDIAINAARNPQRLADLRATLRQRVLNVYSTFPGDVEKAYRIAWKRWCEGLPPAPLDIKEVVKRLA